MKNADQWHPTKYIYRNGKLVASRNISEISPASRLMANLVAEHYDRYIPLFAKGRLLDLGCGTVPLYAAYQDYIDENICVDWSNTLHSDKFIDYKCDLSKKLPFRDEEFDTVILSDVLEHIPNPDYLWAEIARVLTKGGRLIMNVPFYYWLHEGPYDYYRYTKFALRRFAELHGLHVIVLQPIGGVPEILADILAKNAVSLPFGTRIAMLIQYLAGAFVHTNIGRKVSLHTGNMFPFGYFLVAEKPSH